MRARRRYQNAAPSRHGRSAESARVAPMPVPYASAGPGEPKKRESNRRWPSRGIAETPCFIGFPQNRADSNSIDSDRIRPVSPPKSRQKRCECLVPFESNLALGGTLQDFASDFSGIGSTRRLVPKQPASQGLGYSSSGSIAIYRRRDGTLPAKRQFPSVSRLRILSPFGFQHAPRLMR